MTTKFPDTDPLPDRAPEPWDALPDWASVRTGDEEDRLHKVVSVYVNAPDQACAEARALMTMLLESEWDLRGASAEAAEVGDGDDYRVEVTVPRAFDDWGRVHRATEGLNALWAAANPEAVP